MVPPEIQIAQNANMPNFGDPKSSAVIPSNGTGGGSGIGSGEGGGLDDGDDSFADSVFAAVECVSAGGGMFDGNLSGDCD